MNKSDNDTLLGFRGVAIPLLESKEITEEDINVEISVLKAAHKNLVEGTLDHENFSIPLDYLRVVSLQMHADVTPL